MSRPVAVVTGASAGVGRASARAFAEKGYRVALLARGEDGLKAAATEVESLGGEALVLPTDVAHMDQVEDAAHAVETEWGSIDVWVNCAMTGLFAPFLETSPEEFRRATEVTYLGYVHGTYAALRRMKARDAGHIVQVGSALAYRAIPLQSAYCGAKHAVRGFTESVRTELLHDKSRVVVTQVHLPAVNTPQFRWLKSTMPHRAQPVPPIYQPEVPARAIVWAAEHRRREVWVGAPAAATILGSRLIPGLLDHYLGKTGYAAQQVDAAADPDAPYTLWEPVAGDQGAHGVFDDRAHPRSLQSTLSMHRGATVAAAAVALAAASSALRRRST